MPEHPRFSAASMRELSIFFNALGVEEHQREQLERHDQHDAAEAVDVRDAMPRFLKKAVMTPLRPSSRIHE